MKRVNKIFFLILFLISISSMLIYVSANEVSTTNQSLLQKCSEYDSTIIVKAVWQIIPCDCPRFMELKYFLSEKHFDPIEQGFFIEKEKNEVSEVDYSKINNRDVIELEGKFCKNRRLIKSEEGDYNARIFIYHSYRNLGNIDSLDSVIK